MLGRVVRYIRRRSKRFNEEREREAFRNIAGRGMRRSVETRLMKLRDTVGFDGKHILEIGGDLVGKVARACVSLGAERVVSINHDEAFVARVDGKIEYRYMDVRDLTLNEGSFDLVFGFAVLEHIRDTSVALQQIHKILKPGAFSILHGGPLWYSGLGHHVVVSGPSGREYFFSRQSGDSNPLQNWEHLLFDGPELAERLIQRGVPSEDATEIVIYVEGTDLINRYSSRFLEECVQESELTLIECVKGNGKQPGADILGRLSKRHSVAATEFSTKSIQFLMRKLVTVICPHSLATWLVEFSGFFRFQNMPLPL